MKWYGGLVVRVNIKYQLHLGHSVEHLACNLRYNLENCSHMPYFCLYTVVVKQNYILFDWRL